MSDGGSDAMKKVLALLAVAALVGILISRGEGKDSAGPGQTSTAEAQKKTEAPPGPREESDEPNARIVRQKPKSTESSSPDFFSPPPSPKQPDTNQSTSSDDSPEVSSSTPSGSSATEGATWEAKPDETGIDVWLEKARQLIKDDQQLKARKILTEKYLNSPGKEREAYRKLLDEINEHLIWDPTCTTGAETYRLQQGDTLGKVARKYDINWRMIARLNGIDNPARIRAGDELKILTGEPRILVTKSEFTLTLLIDDYYVKEYPVGIGKNDKTPNGKFTVDNCLVEPDWYKPSGGLVKYGEEGHLLGDRWMGFEDKPGVRGYGIHGTNDPDSVGTKCSQGCVRLRNEDVRELYDFVTPGTKVKIVE